MPELFKHQRDLLELNPDKYGLFWQCGSGKTVGAISLADTKKEQTLVLCPKSIKSQWQEKIKQFSGQPDNYVVYTKEEFKKKADNLPKYNCVIIDEASFWANYRSQLSKITLSYLKEHDVQYVYLLTGTPFLSSPFNIYSLAILLGYNWQWYKFKNHFFYDIKMGRRRIPVIRKHINGQPIEKEIAKLVNKIGGTVSLADCVDLPEDIYEIENFSLTKEQRQAIEELDDVLALPQLTHEQQICGGVLKKTAYTPNKYFKTEKLNRLFDYIEQNKKIVIVSAFTEEIHMLYKEIKERFPGRNVDQLTGETENRHELNEKVRKLDDSIFIVQAKLNSGYELETFPILIFYSMNWSFEAFEQMKSRVQRMGHIKKNVYIFFITKDKLTDIDWRIYDNVVNKKQSFSAEIYAKTSIQTTDSRPGREG